MSRKNIFIASGAALVLVIVLIFVFTSRGHKSHRINPAFKKYITAFTSGVISTESTIKIRLATDFADSSMIKAPVKENYFSFSPDIKGSTRWLDSRTLEFKPDEKLPANTEFDAEFYLSKLIDVPDSLSTFEFYFKTIKQAMEVKPENLKAYDKEDYQWEKLTGTLMTADVADGKKVEKTLTAEQDGKKLKIVWIHDDNRTTHHFQIDSVLRKDKASKVLLKWDGEAIDASTTGKMEFDVPLLSEFTFINADVEQEPDQCVVLQFSDPLQDDQELEGLIRLGELNDLRFMIEDNEIRVYPPSLQKGSMLVTIEKAIKNIKGKTLKKKVAREVVFEDIKPAVRLIGKGVIIPRSNGLIFPFEAVNLKAVDVKIIKIYENNIAQFLQVNDLSGEREIRRVGKMILNKTVPLTTSTYTNFGKWNKFSLDLAELIKTEPGAIYKVMISFKKEYSLYKCEGGSSEAGVDDNMTEIKTLEDEDDYGSVGNEEYYGDGYDEYESYYYYDWGNREDPCNDSYYYGKSVSRNVLASDIGIISKRGSDGSMHFYVTDIVTTEPMKGVTLELYDYQKQIMSTLKTNGDGTAEVTLKKAPYLLIAKKDEQRGYLKLDDGSSLSLSMFDVSGEKMDKGIKGFIYGERGVWRPGDSLFLTFILEDKNHVLPLNHPVLFDLINPQGQIVKHMVKTVSVKGFYDFRTSTDATAPTGNWSARVKVGSSLFSKNLKIETIMPNRLKINLDFGKDKLLKSDKNQATLNVKWLHGAIAKNLKADVSVVLNQSTTSFPKFKGFIFDDPARNFYSESHNVFTGKLDDKGNATVTANINTTNAAPGVLMAHFETRVFEEGGAFSIDRFSLPYYPYKSFVGIKMPEGNMMTGMLYTDTNHVVQIVNVDASGNLKGKNKLKIDVYKVEWRWWWDNSNDNLADFISGSYNKPIHSEEINTTNGMAKYVFRVNYPEWGRYLVRITDTESGHCTGKVVYVDWPGWYGKSREGQQEAATMLAFTCDKEKYTVGDKVTLSIPSCPNGRALISLETGSKVLTSYWIDTKPGNTTYSFPVTAKMAPNVYCHITLLQPHAQTKNSLPIRLYGVIPINVEDPNTHLRPVISMANVLAPDAMGSITVKEENGKPMTFTLAVVDEGLLDLTRFKTPDPWSYFYAREALGVKTWDLFDFVMGAYGGELERILSIGGDGEGKGGKGSAKANRFKPMVKFFGPFTISALQAKTYTFKVPQYIGSVRVMVVAGDNGAYGNAEKTVAVRKPLMLLGTLPRVVGPGETVKLPVSVFAMEKYVKSVNVQLTTNSMFSIVGGAFKSMYFKQPGDDIVNFDLKVNSGIGIGTVKIIATSGAQTAVYDIEIDVRNPNPKVVNVVETIIKPGEIWNTAFTPPGMDGTNRGTIEVSSMPPINLEKRLKYLIEYPHGCIEQTTSSVFPQLYLSNLIDMNSYTKSTVETNIKAGIQRIKSMQVSNGGLAYWPGDMEADDWGTNYGGHFMLEAAEKGYTLPVGFLDNWKKFQKQRASYWSVSSSRYNTDLIQAYRLYTLALAKAPELGAMNRLRETNGLSVAAKWRLAAAYQLAGQPEIAKKLVYNISWTITPYKELYFTYGSDVRDKAMILEALSLMNQKAKAAPLLKDIASSMCKDSWMSTQTTAYCLVAISKFVGNTKASSAINYSYRINAGGNLAVNSSSYISQVSMLMKGSSNPGTVVIKNNGKNILYARLIMEGIPETGDKSAAQNNLKLKIEYKNLKGKTIDPSKLEQGTDFYAEVTVTNPGTRGEYREMALTQIFPSGWEIHNARMDNYNSSLTMSTYDYQNIRDDRVYTYFDIAANKSKVFKILLNASYAGQFYLPTIYAEAMYDATINARQPGKWIEVYTPKP